VQVFKGLFSKVGWAEQREAQHQADWKNVGLRFAQRQATELSRSDFV